MPIRTLRSKNFEGDLLYQSSFPFIEKLDSFPHTNKLQLTPASSLPLHPSTIQLAPTKPHNNLRSLNHKKEEDEFMHRGSHI